MIVEANDPEYIAQREMTPASVSSPEFRVCIGLDGRLYAVFSSEWEAYEFDLINPHYFNHCPIACCGGYMNAFELGYPQ